MKQKISYVDIGYIPNPVFVNGNPMLRSFYCGLISIVIIAGLILYSISKLSTLGSVVNYQTHEVKNNPLVNLKDLDLNLTVIYFDLEDFDIQFINGSNMFQYGLNISVEHQTVNKSNPSINKVVSMYMIDQQIQSIPTFALPKNISTQLQTNSRNTYKKLRIIIEQCNKAESICKVGKKQNKYLSIAAGAMVNDDFANDLQVEKYMEVWASSFQLASPYQNTKALHFGSYQFTSDLSILPKSFGSQSILKSWCYFDTMDNDISTLNTDSQKIRYFTLELNAEQYTYYSSQTMQKIDFILPQIFTLFSLAALMLKVVSSHYRRWALQLQAVHEIYGDSKSRNRNTVLSSNDETKNIMGINLKNYFKYLTASKKDELQEVSQTKAKLEKVIKKIDYIKMGKKIHKLQKAVKMLCKINKLPYQQFIKQIDNEPDIESGDDDESMENKYKNSNNSLLHSQ